jgi:chemotaxis protein CheD
MGKTRIVVGISDAKVSTDPSDVLVTYSLGSCIGVCFYDPVIHTGGMLHYQLPTSEMDPQRAQTSPFMFADTGVKLVVAKLSSLGACLHRLQVTLAGGATMATGPQGFDIGKRNYLAIRKILWSSSVIARAEDIGGSAARTLYMDIADGSITVKSVGVEKCLC